MSTDPASSIAQPTIQPTISFLASVGSKERKIWSYAETTSLIALRYDPETRGKFDTMKRNRYLWEEIAEKMQKAGHQRSAVQCSVRWKNLMSAFKQSYGQVKAETENPSQRPTHRRLCSFYREMESALAGNDIHTMEHGTVPNSTHLTDGMAPTDVGLQFPPHSEGQVDDGMTAPIESNRMHLPEDRAQHVAEEPPRSQEGEHQRNDMLVTPPPPPATMPMGSSSVTESMLVEIVGKLKNELIRQREQFETFERKIDGKIAKASSGECAKHHDEESKKIEEHGGQDENVCGNGDATLGKRVRAAEGDEQNHDAALATGSDAPLLAPTAGVSLTLLMEVIDQLREELKRQRKQFESFERRTAKFEGLLSLLMEKVDTLTATVDRNASSST